MKASLFLLSIYTITMFSFSYFVSNYTYTTDFPCFYSTARTILDYGIGTNKIYKHSEEKESYIPEKMESWKKLDFNYAKIIAITMIPLGLFPYYVSKGILIFLNISAYLFGSYLSIRTINKESSKNIYLLGGCFFWLPFIQDIRFAQVDGIIFSLIVISLWLANNRMEFSSGLFIGVSALFKIFPLALSLPIAIKNKRFLYACLFTFISSFSIPGSSTWISSIPSIRPNNILNLYKYVAVYAIIASLILFTTAFYIYKRRLLSHNCIYSISIPVIFLCLPTLEYYHLTLLSLSYIYIFSKFASLNLMEKLFSALSILLIFSSTSIHPSPMVYLGIFLCWIIILTSSLKTEQAKTCDFG